MTHHDDEEDEGWVKRSEPSDHSVGEYGSFGGRVRESG